jgi:hypothetical protein
MRYCILTERSQVFLQSGGEIMCKQLNAGDSVVVNFWCIVAFENTCAVSMTAHPQLPFYALGMHGVLTTVRGPGKLYLSAHGGGPRSSAAAVTANGRGFAIPAPSPSPLMTALRMVLVYLAVYALISYLTTYLFLDEELLNAVDDYLQRLDNMRRDGGGGGGDNNGGGGEL